MKGILVTTFVAFILSVITAFIIFLILPNILAVWQFITGHPPILINIVVKPEFIPLTADHSLYSLLSSTDEQTGKSVQELLAYAAMNRNTSFVLKENGKSFNIDLKKIVDSKMKFLLPDFDYNLVVTNRFSIGNEYLGQTPPSNQAEQLKKVKSRSSSTITLPDLSKVEVKLFIG